MIISLFFADDQVILSEDHHDRHRIYGKEAGRGVDNNNKPKFFNKILLIRRDKQTEK